MDHYKLERGQLQREAKIASCAGEAAKLRAVSIKDGKGLTPALTVTMGDQTAVFDIFGVMEACRSVGIEQMMMAQDAVVLRCPDDPVKRP